ncbi:hypothetical protein [Streptomyces sp. NPDC058657]|uniref:hypothetical protein n=1 Tax=unclassified Streptomyces TaxID=2593676 RepID=UPI00365C2B52
MNTAVGILMIGFGVSFVIFAGPFSRLGFAGKGDGQARRSVREWNKGAFMVGGVAISVLGILFAAGVIGS